MLLAQFHKDISIFLITCKFMRHSMMKLIYMFIYIYKQIKPRWARAYRNLQFLLKMFIFLLKFLISSTMFIRLILQSIFQTAHNSINIFFHGLTLHIILSLSLSLHINFIGVNIPHNIYRYKASYQLRYSTHKFVMIVIHDMYPAWYCHFHFLAFV